MLGDHIGDLRGDAAAASKRPTGRRLMVPASPL